MRRASLACVWDDGDDLVGRAGCVARADCCGGIWCRGPLSPVPGGVSQDGPGSMPALIGATLPRFVRLGRLTPRPRRRRTAPVECPRLDRGFMHPQLDEARAVAIRVRPGQLGPRLMRTAGTDRQPQLSIAGLDCKNERMRCSVGAPACQVRALGVLRVNGTLREGVRRPATLPSRNASLSRVQEDNKDGRLPEQLSPWSSAGPLPRAPPHLAPRSRRPRSRLAPRRSRATLMVRVRWLRRRRRRSRPPQEGPLRHPASGRQCAHPHARCRW